MSIKSGRKFRIILTSFVLSGAFLFVLIAPDAFAYHSTSTYDKEYNGTLTAEEWNDLFDDFVNTWAPASMSGPLGIGTAAPDSGLEVNGPIVGTSISGTYSGLVDSANVSAGEFGSNASYGHFYFGATGPGNVGIGTTDPSLKLEVSGSNDLLKLTSDTTYASIRFENSVDNDGYIQYLQDDMRFFTADSAKMIIQNDGNVGIGTTNPGVKLQVLGSGTGNTVVSRFGNDDSTAGNYAFIDVNQPLAAGGSYHAYLGTNDAGVLKLSSDSLTAKHLAITTSGNVGIGTTAPESGLHVYGTDSGKSKIIAERSSDTSGPSLEFREAGTKTWSIKQDADAQNLSSLDFQNSSGIEVMSILQGGNVGIGTISPTEKLEVSSDPGNIKLGPRTYLGSTYSWQGTVVGNAVKSELSTNAGRMLESVTDAAGASALHLNNGRIEFHAKSGSTTVGATFSSERMRINSSGYVGIGTTDPSTYLDISGTTDNILDVSGGQITGLNSTPTDASHAVPLGYLENNYAPLGSGEGGIGVGISGQTLRHNGTSWVANSVLFNDGANVGIGTDSPSQKLSVVENTANHVYIGLQAGEGKAAILTLIADDGDDAADNAEIFYNADNRMGFKTGGTGTNEERLSILSAGNVGIGTTNPGANLQIDDSTTSVLRIKDTGYGYYDFIVDGGYYKINAETTGNLLTIDGRVGQSGNVGIGITNPSNKLQVAEGNVKFANSATVGAHAILSLESGNTGQVQVRLGDTDDNDQARLWFTNSDRLLKLTNAGSGIAINTSGNVGIGTTTPSTYLDVTGTAGDILDVSGGLITGLNSTPTDSSHAVPLGYLENNYAPLGSGEGGIGIGTSGQTLRHDGTSWIANSVLYNNGTNVGIGTSNPGAKLEINGDIAIEYLSSLRFKATNGSVYGAIDVDDGSNGYYSIVYDSWGADAGSNNMHTFQTNHSTRMVINNDGNVGIGTTNPGAQLEINPGATASKSILVNWSNRPVTAANIAEARTYYAFGYGPIRSGDTDGIYLSNVAGLPAFQGINTSDIANNILLQPFGGSIGIGTTNPSAKLDVDGSLKVSTYGWLRGSSDGANAVALRLGRKNDSESQFVNIYTQDEGGDIMTTEITRYNANFIFKNSYGSMATPFTINIGYTDGARLFLDDENSVRKVSIDSKGSSYFNGGYVGIGTTTPSTYLDVTGTAGDILDVSGGQITGLNSTPTDASHAVPLGYLENNYAPLGSGEGGIGLGTSGQTLRHDGTSWVANSALFNNGTKVGIGTTNPTENLVIQDTDATVFDASSNTAQQGLGSTLSVRNQDGATGSFAQISFHTSAASGRGLARIVAIDASADNTDLAFVTEGSATPGERMRIDSSGNVGIGLTNPTAKLHVSGNAIISGTLTTQTGADFAEEFVSAGYIEPGTVVVMSDIGYKSVEECGGEYDKTVVGIVSDNPSIIAGKVDSDNKVVVAMMGVVSVKVSDVNGDIEKGDLLTTSDIKGYAMRADDNREGTIIGKALENSKKRRGVVKVLVNLQ